MQTSHIICILTVTCGLSACIRQEVSGGIRVLDISYDAAQLSTAPSHDLPPLSEESSYWLIKAKQDGADVRLEARNAKNELVASSDWHRQIRGVESLVLEASANDTLMLRVVPIMLPRDGRVQVQITQITPISGTDHERKIAERQLSQALMVSDDWSPEYWKPRIEKLAKARAIFSDLGMMEELAWAVFLEAFLRYTYLTEWNTSAKLSQKAQLLFDQASMPEARSIAISLEAMSLIEQSPNTTPKLIAKQREQANKLFEEAIEIQTSLGLTADLAWTTNCKAIGEYYQGKQERARDSFERAKLLAIEARAMPYFRLAAKNLIVINRGEGFKDSLLELQKILSETSPSHNPTSFGLINLHLGERQLEHGEWQESITAYSTALEYLTLPADQLQARLGLTRAYLLSGSVDRARAQFNAISALEIDQNESAIGLRLLVLEADLALKTGKPDTAETILEKALSRSTNPRNTAFLLSTLSRVKFSLENFQEATALATRAVALLGGKTDKPMLADTLLTLAESMLNMKPKYEPIEKTIRAAERVLKTLHQPLLDARLYYLRAALKYSKNEIQAAILDSETAIALAWNQRYRVGNNEYRTNLLESQWDIYNQHVELLLEAPKSAHHPLSFIEGIRGRTPEAIIEPGLRFKQNRMSELAWLLSTSSDMNEEVTSNLERELEDERLSFDLHTKEHREVPSVYISDNDIRAIQDSLPKGAVIFSYWLRGDKPSLWVIDPTSIKLYPLSPEDNISNATRELYSRAASGMQGYEREAADLWRKISPAKEDLINIEHIYIVADAELHYAPWPLLVPKELTVSLLPSITSLMELGVRPPVKNYSRLLITGNPVYASEKLSPLAGSSHEIDAIAQIAESLNPHILEQYQATKQHFISAAADYDLLHIAMHALFDNERPLLSGIAFSEASSTNVGSFQNYLTPNEISRIRLSHSPLVVLSACQTAFGRHPTLEGFSGYPNAFFNAGASAVLVSLWDVPDFSTAQLMTLFYKSILKDLRTPAAALRLAQSQVRENPRWRHPIHWGGWIIIES